MQKIRYIAILTTLLIVSMACSTIATTAVGAAPVHHKATHAYIGATPNPIGVGQETLIHLGITDELQNVNYGWKGLTVTVTEPDGTTRTLGPFNSDATGGTGTVLVPDEVGTWKLQTHFPAQWFNWTQSGGADIYYEADDSEVLDLIVNDEPRSYYPGSPLPSEYWTRPIDDQHREWFSISGNWLQPVRNVGPYVEGQDNAPETSHVLWAKPLTVGGLVGGEFNSIGYENGDAYEGLWGYGSPVIINGIMFYNNYKDDGTADIERTVKAVDLRTGEELWNRALIGPDNRSLPLKFGQVFYWQSYNYQGAFNYLWTTNGATWHAFDPYTGRWVYTMNNVPSGQVLRGERGEFYIYTLNIKNGWMTLWNSSRVVSNEGSWMRRNSMGAIYDISMTAPRNGGFEWNVTVPKDLPGSTNVAFYGNMLLGSDLISRTADANIQGTTGSPKTFWALNVKPGQEGQLIFKKSWQPPTGNLSLTFEEASLDDNVFTVWSKELRGRFAFNLQTGAALWGPTEPEKYLQVFGLQSSIAYGKLFSTGYGGVVYAYDVQTGNLIWNYTVLEPWGGSEELWSNNWPLTILFITDGKIYMANSEHSANQPLPRGAPFLVLDVETGEVVFRIDGAFRQVRWAGQAGIADGIIGLYNTYDNQVYGIGKGPSKTTITTSPKTPAFGGTVLIEGTVMDISAGTQDPRVMPRFPDGVAAISDDSMNDWMKYVYMQFQRPANATGVDVTLSIVDANGNYRDIGTATSDADGFFAFNWVPDIPGKYTVYASFSGSKAYWPSHSVTAFSVEPAPEPSATTSSVVVNSAPTELYFVGSTLAIIIAIAIVGVLLLRKKA